eukprot:690057-Hanusia_phi.AAC.1
MERGGRGSKGRGGRMGDLSRKVKLFHHRDAAGAISGYAEGKRKAIYRFEKSLTLVCKRRERKERKETRGGGREEKRGVRTATAIRVPCMPSAVLCTYRRAHERSWCSH